MGFVEAVRTCLAKYATFSGRASRSEFWWFALFHALVLVAIAVFATVSAMSDVQRVAQAVGVAGAVVYIALILPMLAATIRRLHDRNRSGWSYFWVLVPFVGGLIVLIWCLQRGVEGDNRFGPDPLA